MQNISRKISLLMLIGFILSLFILTNHGVCYAKTKTKHTEVQKKTSAHPSHEQEALKALKAAIESATSGPAKINLADQGTLNLPEGFRFVPEKQALAFMRSIGNQNLATPELLGVLLSKNEKFRWFISINFIKSGYLEDKDAKSWKSDELLNTIKQEAVKANKERIKKGFSPLEIQGWIESPTYNPENHRMVWSLLAKEGETAEQVVTYNTYILGREGYFKLTLITPADSLKESKPFALKLLNAIHYSAGKRYEDFSKYSDRIAAYGLATLITGVIAKKLGWFALTSIYFTKAWKFLLFLPVFFWGRIKKLFSRKKNAST